MVKIRARRRASFLLKKDDNSLEERTKERRIPKMERVL